MQPHHAPQHTNSIITQIIQGYREMVIERIKLGWTADFISITFKQLPGNNAVVRKVMEEEVTRLYRKFVTRPIRNARTCPAIKLPLWICVPDYPVYKRDKQTIMLIAPNAGRHYHVIALTPPWSRLKESVCVHFDDHQAWYRGEKIFQVHVQSIESDPGFVTDYAFKNTKNRRVNLDEVLILPLSSGEVPARRKPRKSTTFPAQT